MLYIFSGTDTYTKNQHIQGLLAKFGVTPTNIPFEEFQKNQASHLSGDLFASLKVFLFKGSSPEEITEADLDALKSSKNHFIFLPAKLDQRKTVVKKLQADKGITFKNFDLPPVSSLQNWVKQYLKSKNAHIDEAVITYFLERLGLKDSGGYIEPEYELWTIVNELDKLISYTPDKITTDVVKDLVTENLEIEIFSLISAIAERNKTGAYSYLDKFYESGGDADDKAKTIQLTALLSDQLRSILLVKSAIDSRIPDSSLLGETGWKPGRLNILKKLSYNFEISKLKQTLNRLEHLDLESKTANTPGRVLFSMVISQLI